MDAIGHIHQIGGKNKSRIYPSRPWRMILIGGDIVGAIDAAPVNLRYITILSSGIDLDRISDLIAIHWLREMDLEMDRLIGCQTNVMPWEKLGDDWARRYVYIFDDKRLIPPRAKREVGKAASEWLTSVVV